VAGLRPLCPQGPLEPFACTIPPAGLQSIRCPCSDAPELRAGDVHALASSTCTPLSEMAGSQKDQGLDRRGAELVPQIQGVAIFQGGKLSLDAISLTPELVVGTTLSGFWAGVSCDRRGEASLTPCRASASSGVVAPLERLKTR